MTVAKDRGTYVYEFVYKNMQIPVNYTEVVMDKKWLMEMFA